MDDLLIQNGSTYAAHRQLKIAERLGSGVHGIILVAVDKNKGGKTAIKVHRERASFLRELSVYECLTEAKVSNMLGFNVPQFIAADATLQIIQMSIVKRPYVLDFAGAYLNQPPQFSEEAWADWESEKQEQFDAGWPQVQAVLAALRELRIHMVDVSPGNIAFQD